MTQSKRCATGVAGRIDVHATGWRVDLPVSDEPVSGGAADQTMSNDPRWVSENLAAMLLAQPWTRTQWAEALRRFCMPESGVDQVSLIADLSKRFPSHPPPSMHELTGFLLGQESFERATAYYEDDPQAVPVTLEPPLMAPAAAFANLPVPQLRTTVDVADWLGLAHNELAWFADTLRQHVKTRIPDLQHYTYRFVSKRTGPPRLLEAPKPRLKTMQRQILRDILNHVPTHEAAHGFVRGRSCLTAARKHAGEQLVVAIDLKDFFPRTRVSRIHRLFRNLGYPHDVARLLTDVCTTSTPDVVFEGLPTSRRDAFHTRQVFRDRHLPQGAPTSPALANAAAWMLDVRLTRFAARFDAAYTRYADDMTFSGGDELNSRRKGFSAGLREIVQDAGYRLNPRKTRIMGRATRQRVTGVVVNAHVNIGRREYDRLKATLYNCVRLGPSSQNHAGHDNYRAHLEGKVTWVESVNPTRGMKLRTLFNAIAW